MKIIMISYEAVITYCCHANTTFFPEIVPYHNNKSTAWIRSDRENNPLT